MRKELLLHCGLACWALAAQAQPVREVEFGTQLFPPYVVAQPQGQPAGPLVDVLNAACRNLGWSCRARIYPWRRAGDLLDRGEVDGLFPVLDTPARRASMRLSVPVIDARYVFFSRRGDDFVYRNPQSLVGREIGVYGPSGTATTLQDMVGGLAAVRVRQERDNLVALKMLAAGRYGDKGLVFANEQVALALMASNEVTGLQSSGGGKDINYVFGLGRQRMSEADFKAFDAALAELCRAGTTAELVRPYALPASACDPSPAPVRR